MQIVLTHGYFLATAKGNDYIPLFPPLGILSLAPYLNERGISATVIDSTFLTPESLLRQLLEIRPEFIGFYSNLMTKVRVLDTITAIRNTKGIENAKIVVGGPDVRYNVEKYINFGVDFAVIGEGEKSLYELVETWKQSGFKGLKDVHGIAFKDENGTFIQTPEREVIQHIDELPFPDREAIDMSLYLDEWKKRYGMTAMSINTMRGCPYSCRWCSRSVYGTRYRRRSPKLVIEELGMMVEKYKPDTIKFFDDVFAISHRWVEEFAEELSRSGLKIRYECKARADRLNERIIKVLKETGCIRVWIGAESGSQKVLDAMERGVSIKQVESMMLLSRKHGIETGAFIMLGYPGETEEDINETIKFLKRANPNQYVITVAYPIAGTPFAEDIEADLLDQLPWDKSTDREIRLRRLYSRRYYYFAIQRIHNEVALHKLSLGNGSLAPLKRTKRRILTGVAKLGMWWERSFSKNGTKTEIAEPHPSG